MMKNGSHGRPHPGARIETIATRPARPVSGVAPTRGRGSKPLGPSGRAVRLVAPTRGRGSKQVGNVCFDAGQPSPPPGGADRNMLGVGSLSRRQPSPPPGGADRNQFSTAARNGAAGRPHPGARIETRRDGRPDCRRRVAPTRGRGSKLPPVRASEPGKTVAPTRGRGSKHHPGAAVAIGGGGRPHPGARIETPIPTTWTRSR